MMILKNLPSARRSALLAALAIIPALLLSLAGPPPPAEAAFPFVTGRRALPIVIGRDAPDVVREAVGDLLHYIEASTGIRPALREVRDAGAAAGIGPAILLGAAAGFELTEHEVGFDGYRFQVTDGMVRIGGANPAGTANGIYDLLATGIGVRFLIPGDDGVLIPSQREVRIPETDRLEHPAFDYRFPWFNDNVRRNYSEEQRRELRRFVYRNRGGGIHAITGHYFATILPADRNFETHPEYFAEVQGKRLPNGQLCTSHPDVVLLTTEYWQNRFERDPDLRVGSLSPNDGGLFCTCERCELEDERLPVRLVRFMNDVSRRVSHVYPDRLLSFYTYGPLADPVGIRLNPNLVATVTRYNVCEAHTIDNGGCPSNADFYRQLRGWHQEAAQIMAREFACWWHLPDLATHVMAENLRIYQRNGAFGVSREYLRRGFGADLMRYVDLQLMWDPSEDPDRLVDDFLRGRYGPAAPEVRRVIDELRLQLEGTPAQQLVRANEAEIFKIYSVATLRAAVEELERVADTTPGVHGERVQTAADLLRAGLLHRRVTELTHRYSITARNEDLERLTDAMDEAAKLYDRLEAAGVLGCSFADALVQLQRKVEGQGLGAPVDGTIEYEDDMAHGGFSRRDADRIEGFYAGQYGLALLPGKSGRVAYTLTAAPGRRFTRAELRRLVFKGSNTQIEVKVGDAVHVFAENETFDDMQHTHDLTEWVRGAESFALIFWAKNNGSKPLLCLDNWGILARTE